MQNQNDDDGGDFADILIIIIGIYRIRIMMMVVILQTC